MFAECPPCAGFRASWEKKIRPQSARGWGASVMTAPGCGGGDGPLYLPGNQPSPQEKTGSYLILSLILKLPRGKGLYAIVDSSFLFFFFN